jgi:hypothetical protein
MVNGIKLRMFKDRMPVGLLIKRGVGSGCSKTGIQPFYCKRSFGAKK